MKCSNFAHPFMLTKVRGLENMQHLIVAFGNSFLCTKLNKTKTRQSSVNANHAKRGHEVHRATLK